MWTTEISAQVDDLVCSVYRPQVRATVHSNAAALHTSIAHFCDCLRAALEELKATAPSETAESDAKTLELLLAKSEASVDALCRLAQQ